MPYKKTDLVLLCRKCHHLLFVEVEKININWIKKWLSKSCPVCGEENKGNWIIERLGSYDKEYGE